MKEPQKFEDLLIDKFYNENGNAKDGNETLLNEYASFKENLEASNKKLEILNDNVFDFTVDTMSIIEQAESMRKNKRAGMEFIMFILISMAVLSIYAALGIAFGLRVIIASQVIIMGFIPWIVIPIAAASRKGSEA